MTARKLSVVLAAAGLSIAAAAVASNATKPFTVSATVSQNCTITVNNLDFGAYDPVGVNSASGSDVSATANISVNCTKGSSGVTVGLDRGANVSGTQRRMADPVSGDFLNYSIKDDNGNDWDQTGTAPNVTLGTQGYSGFTSAATAVTHTAHGTLTKGQDVSIGTYTDTVQATVVF
jgi:spore coat protein U-like protein